MSDDRVFIAGDRVDVGGNAWKAPVQVLDAALVGGLVVLVLDWTPLSEGRKGPVQNLRAYYPDGREVWRAANPTRASNDCYTNISERDPLWVGNFAGYRCRIDPVTGSLLESVFTK